VIGTVLIIVFALVLAPIIFGIGCWVLIGVLELFDNERARQEVSSAASTIKRLAVIVLVVWVLIASINALGS
jgi:hypothetical protein